MLLDGHPIFKEGTMSQFAKRIGFIAAGRLLPPGMIILLAALALVLPVRADDTATVEISPSVVDITVGEETTLDIILNDADGSQVVSWETHFTVTDGSVVEVVNDVLTGEPVQEQGPGLALDGLERLAADGSNEGTAQYFTAQNQYDASGQLDYTVTLLRFDPADPGQRVDPFSGNPELVIGRITLKGIAEGTTQIQAVFQGPETCDNGIDDDSDGLVDGDDPDCNIKIIVLTGDGAVDFLLPVNPAAVPLATINVGPAIEFMGKVAPQEPLDPDPENPAWFIMDLTVTFWEPGAIPPWAQGEAEPVATFDVTSDINGIFVIASPPEGVFDVRVKERRTLTNLVAGIDTVAMDGQLVDFGNLRDGDSNNDNLVDGLDFSGFIRLCFGEGLPIVIDGTDCEDANFNRDDVVDGQDFSRLKQNFGTLGD
jgi:hypothetical protein